MKNSPSRKSSRHEPYESAGETTAAIGRIHALFEKSKTSLAAEKKFRASPEGVLRSTLQTLLNTRKAVVAARKEIDAAIITLRRSLPRK